jgi:hypothetical protein
MGESADPTRIRAGLGGIVNHPVAIEECALYPGGLGIFVSDDSRLGDEFLLF